MEVLLLQNQREQVKAKVQAKAREQHQPWGRGLVVWGQHPGQKMKTDLQKMMRKKKMRKKDQRRFQVER